LGATCNTADDALKAVADGADYLGVGPFRFTETKQKLAPVLGLEGYENIMDTLREHNADIPLYAIGGITADDLLPLKQAGVYGVAVSGMLLNSGETEIACRKILEVFA
jgi:thiamine-phosphate pyrophosphorylase